MPAVSAMISPDHSAHHALIAASVRPSELLANQRNLDWLATLAYPLEKSHQEIVSVKSCPFICAQKAWQASLLDETPTSLTCCPL